MTYKSGFKLEIDGQAASSKLVEDILQISIEESLHMPSMFTIVVRNSALPGRSDTTVWEHEALFAIGKSIRVGFKNSTTESASFQTPSEGWVLFGEITAIETHFTAGSQAPIIIRGYDRSHRLHRGYYNRSFQNMTDTDIVKKIVGELGITLGTVESSGNPHPYVFQENQTNMEFLRERAARNGFELFVQDDKLHFRKPKQDGSLRLEWLKDLTSFQVRVTSAEQVSEVEVRGWDSKQKRSIIASKNNANILTETEHGQGRRTSSAFQGKPGNPKLVVVDQPIATQQEAEKIAQALFHELSDEFVQADAQSQGNPAIRPGRVVTLEKMGKYSGKYYITETHHIYNEGVYTTAFSIRGLRGGDLLSLLSPATRLQPGQTLLIGIVTNNQDPDKLGRVRVKLPTLTEDHESEWARVVAIGAGKARGFDCLPEIDDEVLVGFEHGDIHRPFVIGGLWNGQDAPPTPVDQSVGGSGVRLRTFKTRTGHHLQFVEEDQGSSKKGILIKSVYGHQVYLNDSEKKIEIRTQNGHVIVLDDSGRSIKMKSMGGHQLSLDDAGQSISLESTGSVTLKATTNLDIQANGMVNVKGMIIKLN